MKLTIGMASYNNFNDVYFTVQCLRAYHNLEDCEVLIVDNFGDKRLEDFWKHWGKDRVRYEKYVEVTGTTMPRQKVFEFAEGEFVVCIDSHVLLFPGSVDKLKEWIDSNQYPGALVHGPMVYDDFKNAVTHMNPVWRGDMWGIWADIVPISQLPIEPFEIPMHGLGLFGSRKDAWLNFNPNFRGFGGEEGYIHEKFRKHGRKVLCLPFLKWSHRFNQASDIKYPLDVRDRIRNYVIGFKELGLSLDPIKKHFGVRLVETVDEGV